MSGQRVAARAPDARSRYPAQSAAPSRAAQPSRAALLQRACAACEHNDEELRAGSLQRWADSGGLAVGPVGDAFEQEADRVAAAVVTGGETRVERRVGGAGAQRDGGDGVGGFTAPTIVGEVLRSAGTPLDAATRDFMEAGIGHDFSRVRVHDDGPADASARAVNALAYTVGHDITFRRGLYDPSSSGGRRLLAHELAHVAQQGSAGVLRPKGSLLQRQVSIEIGGVCMLRSGSELAAGDSVMFTQGSSAISATSRALIERLARARPASGGGVMTVHGYASEEGQADFNEELSCERGRAVAEELERAGIPPGETTVVGHGETTGYGPTRDTNRRAVITTAAAPAAAPAPAAPLPAAGPAFGTVATIVANVRACDGGLNLWAAARTANRGNDPQVQAGPSAPFRGETDVTTGTIRISESFNACAATQTLVQELANLSRSADIVTASTEAAAGQVSRADFIRRIERIEYETGVQYVIRAFDACSARWGCPVGATSEKEWARGARSFDDYFSRLLNPTHPEHYGTFWDANYRAAWERNHPPAGP